MKKFIKNIVNIGISPFGAEIVSKKKLAKNPGDPGDPGAHALRMRLFKQLASKGFNPAHIIDVGAHKASWSRDAQKIFPGSSYTLIEPQVEMKPYLDRFCSDVKNSRWILSGAGAENGEMPFTIAENSDGSTFTISENMANEKGLKRIMVMVKTLDLICEELNLPVPEIIKIDAEGLDLDVIMGAKKMLGLTEIFFLELPLFFTWANQSFHIIIEFMRDNGYEPYDITDLNRRPSDSTLALIEMAFVKRDSFLRKPQKWD